MLFNSDTTGSNYDLNGEMQTVNSSVSGNTEATGSNGITAGVFPGTSTSADAVGVVLINILGYSSTSFMKEFVAISSSGGGTNGQTNIRIQGGRWKNTAAITSMTLTAGAGNFVDGTIATLELY